MDLSVVAMKGYYILLKAREWKAHHQIQFRVKPRTPLLRRSGPSSGGIPSVYSTLHEQDEKLGRIHLLVRTTLEIIIINIIYTDCLSEEG